MAQQASVSEELLADWSADLEAVLYAPEVEEAIQEVIPPVHAATAQINQTH